jgi:ribose/xylose/arabinose/galactoside ABC-type transport system permease subunit
MASVSTKSTGALRDPWRLRLASLLQRQGVVLALAALVIFSALRYENFLSATNISDVLGYNAMFGLLALGMTFVIISGGIDLSVGSVAALASVIAARFSVYGLWPGLLVPLAAGLLVGLINGWLIARLRIAPFIVTLAMLLAARGLALMFSNNTSIAISYTSDFKLLGQQMIVGLPLPAILTAALYLAGGIALTYAPFGRHVLAIGGNEEAARLMGLPVQRLKVGVYALSGVLAALAGVILAARYGSGQPTEGNGWELAAIASVVVGGTLLTGGIGSVWSTLAGVLLLGLIFNILNFENSRGTISLSFYWQSVIRGVFLLIVVLVQNRLARRDEP